MNKTEKKLIRFLVAVISLVVILTGVGGPAFADSISGWDEMSFEAQNNYRIFDIDSGRE